MAERWQQWMPFHIDRFRGSLHVQGMPGCARSGYLYLLMAAWQTEDCSLPSDDADLQILSGLTFKEWNQFKAVIRKRFTLNAAGKLVNAVLREFWDDSREVFEKRQNAAKNATSARTAYGHRNSTVDSTETVRPRAADTRTLTETLTPKKEQRPSRDKREGDSRHVPFRLAVETYAKHKGVLFAWDGGAAKQLDLLLKSTPDLTLLMFQTCLNHRARSPGTPHGEHPKVWLPHVLKYQQGPLDQFGKTGEANGNHSKTGASVNAAQQAIGIIRGRQAGADGTAPGEAGHPPASEAGRVGLLGSG